MIADCLEISVYNFLILVIWFNTNAKQTIHKWLYTDFLGNGIYLRVPSTPINDKLTKHIVHSDIKIDEERCEKIGNVSFLERKEKPSRLTWTCLLSVQKVIDLSERYKFVLEG